MCTQFIASAYDIDRLVCCGGCGEYDEVVNVDGCISFKDGKFAIEYHAGDPFLRCHCGHLSKDAGKKVIKLVRELEAAENG